MDLEKSVFKRFLFVFCVNLKGNLCNSDDQRPLPPPEVRYLSYKVHLHSFRSVCKIFFNNFISNSLDIYSCNLNGLVAVFSLNIQKLKANREVEAQLGKEVGSQDAVPVPHSG